MKKYERKLSSMIIKIKKSIQDIFYKKIKLHGVDFFKLRKYIEMIFKIKQKSYVVFFLSKKIHFYKHKN